MDNLISNASKDCLAQKQRKDQAKPEAAAKAVVAAEPDERAEAVPVKLVEVLADEASPNSMTTVIVSVGESVVSGVSARLGGSVLESVAVATGKAVERAYPGTRFRLEDIQLAESREGKRVATVTAQVTNQQGSRPVSGAAAVNDDLYFSVAEATIEAFLS